MSSQGPLFLLKSLDRIQDLDYKARLLQYAERLHEQGLPVIFSLKHLGLYCGVSLRALRAVVSQPSHYYRCFEIRKRSGGRRKISVPFPFLMRVQRWILDRILNRFVVAPCATAYCSQGGPYANALFHTDSRWLVKVDVEHFFHSTLAHRVYRFFRRLKYTRLLSFELAQLCCVSSDGNEIKDLYTSKYFCIQSYNNARHEFRFLPQGAPTSPALSNLLNGDMDKELLTLSRQMELRVTRYADDIVFSGDLKNRSNAWGLVARSADILGRYGYSLNKKKSQISSPGCRRVVTGLLVDRSQPRLTRRFRDEIRQHLYYARKFGVVSHCARIGFRSTLSYRNHLWGKIMFARFIDSRFGDICVTKFRAIEWGVISEVPFVRSRSGGNST